MKDTIVRSLRAVPVTLGGEHRIAWVPEDVVRPGITPTVRLFMHLDIVQVDPTGYVLRWHPADRDLFQGPPYEGDTWHESIDDAVHQAQVAFGIPPHAWG